MSWAGQARNPPPRGTERMGIPTARSPDTSLPATVLSRSPVPQFGSLESPQQISRLRSSSDFIHSGTPECTVVSVN